ncbi:MAG: stage III sporulation protein AE [Christensenellaceae bacterium]|jgi:stage III sporulation protein AE|nr:stage III sporulation protein AE [Christensenellaceae bacterium]
MRRLCCLLAFCCLLALPALVWGVEELPLPQPERTLEEELALALSGYDWSAWQQSYQNLPAQVRDLWGYENVTDMVRAYAMGKASLAEGLLAGLGAAALAAFKESMLALTAIMAVALLTGMMDVILDEGKEGVREIASFLCYSVCVLLLSGIMAQQLQLSAGAIADICGALELAGPVLIMLLAAVGATTSAGMAQPLFVFLSGAIAGLFRTALLPAVMSAGVLSIVGGLTGRKQMEQVTGLIKSGVKWVTGGISTIFLGSMTLRGMSAAGVDSVSIKTMKYALDKSLPLVGGVVAGSLESVRGCTLLIKNAAGIASVLLALGMVLIPLMRLAAMSLAFKATAAVCAQVSDVRMPKLLTDMADICRYMFACVAVVALMFVLTIGLVMAMGGV